LPIFILFKATIGFFCDNLIIQLLQTITKQKKAENHGSYPQLT